MKKPGSFDHFTKGTGCTPWFFRISSDTKLNCAFNNSGLNSKIKIKYEKEEEKIAFQLNSEDCKKNNKIKKKNI